MKKADKIELVRHLWCIRMDKNGITVISLYHKIDSEVLLISDAQRDIPLQ